MIRQFAKFSFSPKFVVIRYLDLLYAVCLLRLLREFDTLSFLLYS